MRSVGILARGLAALVLSVAGFTPIYAQSVDPGLQGRVFQTSDGALWIYKDGQRYPVVGLDLSDGQIDAIPARLDQPIGNVGDLFAAGGAPAPAPPPPPPPPAPTLDVGNPHPNESVPPALHMSGIAFDPLAESGSGVDRVQVFVEDRDAGGFSVGDAVPSGSISPNGWEALVNLPIGPHTLFVYARSSVTGREAVVTIPVRVSP